MAIKTIASTFIFCALLLSPFASADWQADLATFIAEKAPQKNMGIAVGVIQNGKILLAQGYGARDQEKKLPVTPQTLFAIGSVTKSFTATALKLAEQKGKLNLDQPIREWLPEFSLQDAKASELMTAHDLLSHHAGLPRHDLLWYIGQFRRDQILGLLPHLGMNPKAGMGFREGFQYNNLMYATAGILLEKVTGKSWEENIATNLLLPLEMKSTQVNTPDESRESDLALPYVGDKLLPRMNIDAVGPAGSIYSNVEDMLKWMQFQLDEGRTAGGMEILSKENMADLYKSHTKIDVPGRDLHYGLGWFSNNAEGIYFHGGNIDGFTALVAFIPKLNLGYVALMNQNATRFGNDILVQILSTLPKSIHAQLPNINYSEFSFSQAGSSILRVEDKEPPVLKEAIYGSYQDPAYGMVKIIPSFTGPKIIWFRVNEALSPSSDKEFTFPLSAAGEVFSVPFSAKVDDVGKVIGLSSPLEPETADILFTRMEN